MAEVIKLGSSGNWGVKEGGVLGFNDENRVFKAIELQSSRASGATYVGEDGLIKDAEVGVPRIDWTNGVGELLLEPQSKNSIPNYNTFTPNANVVLVTDNAISPDGTQNAVKVTGNSGTSLKLVDTIGAVAGTYVFSVFAKKGTHNLIQLGGGGIVGHANFDLDSGTAGSGGVIQAYPNGWYRCSVQFSTGTPTSHFIALVDSLSSARLSTSTSTGDVYLFGMQSEQTSYPTSLIPTSGTLVTRIQDAVSGNSSLENYINSSEGVLYFEGSCLVDDEGDRRISLSDGSASVYRLTFDSSGRIFAVAYNGGSNQCVLVFDTDLTQNFKCAFKYKQNDFALWVNGVEVDTDPSGSVSSSINKLSFDAGLESSVKFFGKVKDLRVYDTALTDAELTTLTKI